MERRRAQDGALASTQCRSAIGTLVLQQMSKIFPRQPSKQPTATSSGPGDLEIHQRRRTVLPHQPVRLLGQIVVHNAVPVQPREKAQRIAVIAAIVRLRLLHWRACDISAKQLAAVPPKQDRDALYRIEPMQRPRFSSCCLARE
jgi:hypothetical protein